MNLKNELYYLSKSFKIVSKRSIYFSISFLVKIISWIKDRKPSEYIKMSDIAMNVSVILIKEKVNITKIFLDRNREMIKSILLWTVKESLSLIRLKEKKRMEKKKKQVVIRKVFSRSCCWCCNRVNKLLSHSMLLSVFTNNLSLSRSSSSS